MPSPCCPHKGFPKKAKKKPGCSKERPGPSKARLTSRSAPCFRGRNLALSLFNVADKCTRHTNSLARLLNQRSKHLLTTDLKYQLCQFIINFFRMQHSKFLPGTKSFPAKTL